MVYVDDMNAKFGRMTMCHMVADSLEELHAMADRIGVARRWFQTPTTRPHYDICLAKKALAVKHGAKEIPFDVEVARIARGCLTPAPEACQLSHEPNAETARAIEEAIYFPAATPKGGA